MRYTSVSLYSRSDGRPIISHIRYALRSFSSSPGYAGAPVSSERRNSENLAVRNIGLTKAVVLFLSHNAVRRPCNQSTQDDSRQRCMSYAAHNPDFDVICKTASMRHLSRPALLSNTRTQSGFLYFCVSHGNVGSALREKEP